MPVPGKNENVYVIDPDADVRDGVATLLGTLDIPVTCYADAQQFLDIETPQSWTAGCILVEAQLRGLTCLDFLKTLRANGNTLPVLVLASTANRAIAERALSAGATAVIERPLVNGHLLEHLHRVIQQKPVPELAVADQFTAKNGVAVTIRAIRPEDAEIEQAFVRNLSARSRYLRFFSGIKELSPYMLERFTHPTYPSSCALIATINEAGQEKQIGVARYAPTDSDQHAEFAIVVADEWKGLGVARYLLSLLVVTAGRTNIRRLDGVVLRENTEMLRLAKRLGFTAKRDPDDDTILAVSRDLSLVGA